MGSRGGVHKEASSPQYTSVEMVRLKTWLKMLFLDCSCEGHTHGILTTDLSGSGVWSGEGVGQGRQEMSVGTKLPSSSV